MDGLALLQQCASKISPVTMSAIIQGESGGDPWTINVNGMANGSMHFQTEREAINAATHYIRLGYKVDLGIAQIDSENLGWLSLSVSQAFNPCQNIQAAQTILLGAYQKAGGNGIYSLKGAFEAYNSGQTSGDPHYARMVYRNAGVEVPAIPGGQLAEWTRGSNLPFLPPENSAPQNTAPVRPVIMMPPKSWQPLTKGEDFAVSTRDHGKEKPKEPQQSAVTAIWTSAVAQ